MKRINLALLLGLFVGVAILAGGVFLLHRFQLNRNAGGLAVLARQRLEQGNTEDAINLFGRYLGMRPDDIAVQREYAELALECARSARASRAELQRAYNSLEEAVRRNPEDNDLRMKLADFQVRVGRFSDAREHLEMLRSRVGQRAVAGDADDDADDDGIDETKTQVLMARALAGEGEFDASARLAGDLIGYDVQQKAFNPDRRPADATEPYVILAEILEQRLNEPEAAAVVLDELGKRRGADALAWLTLAQWHHRHGDNDAATMDMKRAMDISPDNIDVVWGGFELALATGDLATAEAVATRARGLFPEDERVYRGLASIALQRKDLPGAEAALREGVAEMPGKVPLLLMLADTLLQQGKLDEVDGVVTQVQELFGTKSPALGLLQGRVLIARRRWAQARKQLEEARPLAAGNTLITRQIDLCLSQCFENLSEFDEQLDVSRRILVDDPTSLAARVGQASAMASSGRSEEALAEFESVAAAIPPDQLVLTPMVWYPLLQLRVLDQLKRPVAERDWSRIDELLGRLEESPAVSASQLTLLRADILARKGENEAAIDILERAAREPNADPQVLAAFAMLTLEQRGPEAARQVVAGLPAGLADHPALSVVRIQLAATAPAEESARELAAIEARTETLSPEEAASVLSSLINLRLQMGDPAEAERLLRKSAAQQPDDLRSRTMLLDLAMQAGDVEKAKAAADDITAVAGATSTRARVAQAGVKILEVRLAQERQELETGKVDLSADDQRLLREARSLLIEAENERPSWHLIQRYAAEIDGLNGDLPAAISRLQKALRLGPAKPDLVRQLVGLLYATNRLEEARQAIDMLGPDGIVGFERLSAEMELRSGRLDDAVAIAERSVSQDSKNGGDLLWLALLLERSGKRERAGELYAKAVEVSPDRADAWIMLFSHQFATGRRRAAENTLDRAVRTLPAPSRDLVLAQGMEMLGRIDDAERAFRDAAAAAPDDMGIATARAEFLVRVGRRDQARESLRRIVDSKKDDAASRSMRNWARRKLAELTAQQGTYSHLLEALALLDANTAAERRLTAEDAVVRVGILANRPEPASWKGAIQALEKLRELQPLTTAQRLTLAGLLDKVGRWDEARQELMAIVSAPKTPPPFIALLADKLISHGELDNGRAWVKQLMEKAPSAPATVALEARLAIAEKDRTRAVELARRLMPTGQVPTEQNAQLAALAQVLEDLEFPKAADKVLAQYASQSMDGVVAQAQFLGRQRRTDEALDVLEKAWNTLPLERLLTTAMDALRANPKAEAEVARLQRWVAKARRIDPDSIVIDLVEAELLSLQERTDEVTSRYRDILARRKLDPIQKAIVSNNLAFHLAEPKTATEAKKLIDAAIGIIGPHPDLLDTRGVVLLALGEDQQAVDDLEQAILQPSEVKFLHLAYARLRFGDKSAARSALEQGRKKGLTMERLSRSDRLRLRELEAALGIAPEQVGADADGGGRG